LFLSIDEEPPVSSTDSIISGLSAVTSSAAPQSFIQQQDQQQRSCFSTNGTFGTTATATSPVTPVVVVVPPSQLSPISPTLPAQSSPYASADVCHQYYNAYSNYAAAAATAAAAGGKMRTTSPYGRAQGPYHHQTPYHHPHHQNPFPPTPFYPRTVQNPYDYSPR